MHRLTGQGQGLYAIGDFNAKITEKSLFGINRLFLKIFSCNKVHQERSVLANWNSFAFYNKPASRFSIIKILFMWLF